MVFTVFQKPAQTLASWWDEAPYIDLDPVYQRRGHIWNAKEKQDLIDSILNGFDIPKVYLADFTLLDSNLNRNGKKFAVIDGKQRLISIFGFFEGTVLLSRKFVLFDDPGLDLRGLSYSDLVSNYPRVARRFDNFNLTVMGVVTDDEQKINELFLRLNVSKPLTGAEIRNAMVGEVPSLIRALTDHAFWGRVRFSRQRGQDKNTAAKLLLMEHSGTFVDTKKRQLDSLVREVNQAEQAAAILAAAEDEDDSIIDAQETADDLIESAIEAESDAPDIVRSADRVSHVLNRLTPLFVDNDPNLAQQAQIPVIYWLARELDDSALGYLRAFLENFEADRRANRAREIGDPDRDMTLIDFELMARTSNDQGSIAGRYRIMRRLFERFVTARGGRLA